jgi:putative membrane protein
MNTSPNSKLFSVAALAAAAVLALSACTRADDATTTGSSGGNATPADTGVATTTPPSTTSPDQSTAPATTSPETMAGGTATPSPDATMNTSPTGAGTTTPSAATQAALTSAESSFVKTAAGSGLYEVEVARLGADKATDPAIKSYAQMLVEHHSTANDQLRQLASSRNVELPTAVPADKKQSLERLEKASGADFDRQFVQTITRDHQADVALFEKAQKDAKDEQVRNFAQATLPTLQTHLAEARKLPSGSAK